MRARRPSDTSMEQGREGASGWASCACWRGGSGACVAEVRGRTPLDLLTDYLFEVALFHFQLNHARSEVTAEVATFNVLDSRFYIRCIL